MSARTPYKHPSTYHLGHTRGLAFPGSHSPTALHSPLPPSHTQGTCHSATPESVRHSPAHLHQSMPRPTPSLISPSSLRLSSFLQPAPPLLGQVPSFLAYWVPYPILPSSAKQRPQMSLSHLSPALLYFHATTQTLLPYSVKLP